MKSGNARLARRIVVLFVLVSLVPLALSDWVASSAISQIGQRLHREEGNRTTRQVSRQVLDRLIAADALMQTLPAAQDHPADLTALSGPDRAFVTLDRIEDSDRGGERDRLDPAMKAAVGKAVAAASIRDPARIFAIRLLKVDDTTAKKSIAMLALARDGSGWVARLSPSYLWSPVADASEQTHWTVQDGHGEIIAEAAGGGLMQRPAADDSVAEAFETRLYLGTLFDAGTWTFVQHKREPALVWQGRPVVEWLALVALATLLSIAALAQWQIRRTLHPLRQLTSGTRRLAAGELGARVAVDVRDEVGELAESFNEMARRIEGQVASLRSLSAMDRETLENEGIARLAMRIAEHVRLLDAEWRATFRWLEGDTLCRIDAGRDASDAIAITSLLPDARNAFEQLSDVNPAPRFPSTHALRNPEMLAGDSDEAERPHRLTLVVRREGRTRAVIAVYSARPFSEEDIRALQELRNRISVSLVARARDAELVHIARHDSLTGLESRVGLHEALARSVEHEGASTALLLIDLDNFKDLNDSRGHQAGDQVLCQAADRLVELLSPGESAARQGGDEFAMVMPYASLERARELAQVIVDALGRPFVLDGGDYLLGASVGIAIAPLHATRPAELLRCADIALYGAKEAGRKRFQVFSQALDALAQNRVQLDVDLRLAIERSEFFLVYQPRVESVGRVLAGCEALIRWKHPRRGTVLPEAFIGAAEASGSIEAIGTWVIDAACRQLAAWDALGVPIGRMSINVSPRQFEKGDLPAFLQQGLSRHGLAAALLEIEVTEGLLIGDVSATFRQLEAIRALGISVALDDFGTGYSSMSMLASLPYDTMKIDRSFVSAIGSSDRMMAIIRSIVTMAASAGLRLVAEGVESVAQADLLRDLGCHELQGYLFGRPMSADAFHELARVALATTERLS